MAVFSASTRPGARVPAGPLRRPDHVEDPMTHRLALALAFLFTTGCAPHATPLAGHTATSSPSPAETDRTGTVRVLVYNIHAGKDAEGVENLDRVAALVRSTGAELVLFQEVDRGTRRSGNVDQLATLERLTGFHGAFGRTLDYQGGEYGIALLSRWPITADTLIRLPVDPPQERAGGAFDPRGAHQAVVAAPDRGIGVLNTHLDPSADDFHRLQEVATIVEAGAALRKRQAFTVVSGDFNAEPGTATIERMTAGGWTDAWAACGTGDGRTFPADAPVKRIDYLFLAPGLTCEEAEVLETTTSDHRPLLVQVRPAGDPDPIEVARAYRDEHGPRILREFAELLAIPNVASDSVGIRRNADHLVERLAAHGVQAELLTLPGTGAPPIVYGRLDVPGATRTLGIYVHYDGQPADPEEWVHDPWEPTLYTRAMPAGGTARELPRDGEPVDPEWRIYARSAGDDKAPLGALFPVLDALRTAGIPPTSNLVFFFEGEEEAGSAHLGRYFETYPDRVEDIDVWLLLDGPVHQSGRPQLVFGVRGVTSLEVTVYGAARELHSGHYGNWAPVPGRLLAQLLASMYHPDGTVAIHGFYDDVEPLDDVSRAALADLPAYDDALRQELGLRWTEGGARLEERLLQPSLTIHGMRSAHVGADARNVIPDRATVSLGIRLVKGNDVTRMQERVEAHIREQGFYIVRDEPDHATRLAHDRIARVTRGRGYGAARTPMDHPMAASIIDAARRVSGDAALLVPGLGGSLPLYLFTDVLARPTIIVPVANHDNNQHGANENLRVANLWYAMDIYAALLTMP
jgi:acetylornithine deacetylase/succinyl-diaminopimelate desuccinylase-like protein/endonuclease/exonuclease/phosphatase family metal-dependent hydrolase